MPDEVNTEEKPTVCETEEGYAFPDITQNLSRLVYYDEQRHRVWVGVELDKTLDPLHAAETLAGARPDVMVTKVLAMQDQGRKQQLAKPGGVVSRLNQTLKDTFKAHA